MKERIQIEKLGEHIGESVTIAGWVDIRRDHGKLVFIDLRDGTGKVQVVIREEALGEAKETRNEWVLQITGTVKERPEKMVNKDEENGHLEFGAEEILVLNESKTPPFEINKSTMEIGEETRMKYRYLDLRSNRMQNNIRSRAAVNKHIRDYLEKEGFIEIETPILTKSTPEGARDYVVPSRQNPGEFYALPQSPQQYKQLLVNSGFERYFQIARCFRDEDTRGDRQAEFTQLDVEMAFPTQDTILSLIEGLLTQLIEKNYPDKKLTKTPWPRLEYKDVMKEYDTDRPDLRKNKEDDDELAFSWVINFPLFEEEKEDGHLAPSHHMFTMPKEEDIKKLDTDPHEVHSYQHDLVLNGNEIGGGSIRIHNAELQAKIFDLIGFDEKDKKDFEHMLTAFTYGVPPHGGIALGLDRLITLLQKEPSIREVIAFPKTGEGRDLTMNAPSKISDSQLRELDIEIKKKK